MAVELETQGKLELKRAIERGYHHELSSDGTHALIFVKPGNAAIDRVNLVEPKIGMRVKHATGYEGRVTNVLLASALTQDQSTLGYFVELDGDTDWLEWRWFSVAPPVAGKERN